MSEVPRPGPLDALCRPRLLAIAGATFAAIWLLAFVAHEVSTPGLVDRRGNAVGRDFVAFYTGATLVARGDGQRLYDPALQLRVQAEILAPAHQRGYIYFVNPAHVAALYRPFCWLPYRAAFYLHVALMLGCYLFGIWLLRHRLPLVGRHLRPAALVSLAWFPLTHTIVGGQNAALSFLLLAGAYSAVADGRPARAGLLLGLQLFKPQYALPLIGLLLLKGQLLLVGTAAATGAGAYLLGAAVAGWRWPLAMLSSLGSYYWEVERTANGAKHVSLVEVLDYSLGLPLQRAGLTAAAAAVRATGVALVLAAIGYLIWRWRAVPIEPSHRRDDATQRRLAAGWALAVSGSLLVAPHANYYDVGILVLPALQLIDARTRAGLPIGAGARLALLAGYLLLPLAHLAGLASRIGFQPLFVVPIGLGFWAHRTLEQLNRGQKTA